MNKLVPITAAVVLVMTGCGGGGGGSSATTTTGTTNTDGEVLSSIVSGIEIPTEISAVPADNTNGSAKPSSFLSAIQLISAVSANSLPAASDYNKAEPSVYIEERALEQFDIIETVFAALGQTHYADEANVNQGPYKAMIAWEEDQNGKDVKTLQTWTVESRMIVKTLPSDVTGNTTGDTNRLFAWIPEIDRETGEKQLIKAEFLIYTAPTKADDGSLLDFGEWDMNVLMGADATAVDTVGGSGPQKFFAASARVASGGSSVLKVHDKFTEVMGDPMSGTTRTLSEEMKGILVRDGTSGYGQVSYPDWDACWNFDPSSGSNPCETGVPTNVAKYAYNANYLGVQETKGSTTSPAVYKDRVLDGAIRVVHRYALFHADADTGAGIAEGDDAEKHVSFGFPVSYERTATANSNTFDEFAYYGAWQGRHQLWGQGGITPTTDGSDGTTLTRQDVRPGVTAPTYKLKEFGGTFTMRSMVVASLDDIKNIAVETWLNDNYELFYKVDPDNNVATADTDWYFCGGYVDWSTSPQTCRDKATDSDAGFTALTGSSLVSQLAVGSGERRNVNINSCDNTGCTDYVYLTADPSGVTWSGPGFYAAEWGQEGLQAVSGASQLAPADGNQMWVNIGGSIYVAYDGDFTGSKTGWVQKTLTSFDQQTWTPEFDSAGDTPFTPERGVEYYMNAQGQNYVVKRTDADTTADFQVGDYTARLELQTAANPANTDSAASTALSVLPAGTAYLAAPWDADVKYTLMEDPANASYLMLMVAHDASGNITAGTVSSNNTWGLVAYEDVNGDSDLGTGAGFADDVPLAYDGSRLVVDDYGWIDPSANSGNEPVQFNWEYADDQNPWGKQQFLVTVSGSTLSYVILSDQISLTQVGLYDNLGNPVKADPAGAAVVVGGDESNWKKVSLQFDGWLHGMPDMRHELQKNGWSVAGLGDKVRRLLDGQEVTDTNGTRYFVKPMETSLFLGEVNAFPVSPGAPDVSAADAVDLAAVPDYTHHQMGAEPTTNGSAAIEVKYSEGQPLE